MAVEVKRKERETTGSLLRRFTRRVQQSGILIRARKVRFYASGRTKRERRLSALHRERIKAERERLRKLGLLTEETAGPLRR
ncbi:30S ribosomal protein S21 [Candidatus Parcubacteria bacterium]|nr:30S ribosomal protein S21 [Candidatus Parcubacteria bacterium]